MLSVLVKNVCLSIKTAFNDVNTKVCSYLLMSFYSYKLILNSVLNVLYIFVFVNYGDMT